MTERPRSHQAFFAELKRRKVFKVAAFYGGAAFVVLQVVDLVVPALNLPESVMTAAVVVTVLAFPIALAVTWVFDLTPGGVKRTDPAQSGELEAIVALPAARRWPAGLLALAGTALLAVGVWWTIERTGGSETGSGPGMSDRPPSIAVLPFVNMSGGEENEYFSDGITEEILNALAQVPGLKVAARTSAFQFKDRQLDLREVGRQLSVATVLEGSVQRSGDDIRITAQLIDAESGFHIWSGKFDRQLVDIFAVEDEIARAIADTLRAPLGLEPASRLVSRATEDAEAYELYLQGQQMLGRRGASLLRAVSFYERALARDPDYAAAQAGLAEAYALLPFYALGDWEEFLTKAEASARRALALDSTMARAHVALANVRRDLWDWDTAEAHYERAIELAPNDAEARHQYAQHLTRVGRNQAAVAQSYLFLELDPLSPILNAGQGKMLMDGGRYQEAIRSLNKAIELDPNLGIAHMWLMRANIMTGRWDEAELAARLGAALVGEDPASYATLVRAVENPELKSEALSILETATDEYWALSPGAKAYWYILLDEHELAVDALALVTEKGLGNATYFNDAMLDPLRDDPRFQNLLERVGLAR
jgi:TolB-like protein/Tfp pilus assembly protein PilF